nr:MAG TPA: hypothetical protein [Caudoviricetes sp.]
MINFFSIASATFFLVAIFFLGSSFLFTIKILRGVIREEDNWERYIIALVITAFMGIIALGISALSFIASRHF